MKIIEQLIEWLDFRKHSLSLTLFNTYLKYMKSSSQDGGEGVTSREWTAKCLRIVGYIMLLWSGQDNNHVKNATEIRRWDGKLVRKNDEEDKNRTGESMR